MIHKPYKVLIVEDDPNIPKIIREYLDELYGELLQVKICHSVDQAADLLDREDFRIIICDLHMPVKDGSILQKHAQGLRNGIQFIMLTADHSYLSIVDSFLDGASTYISKPFTIDDIKMGVDPCIHKLDYWHNLMKIAGPRP